jgi:DNA polymerase sigma
VHQINDAFGGFVNSFGWTVAVVCFMMNKKLLPMFDLDSPPPEKKIDVNEANPVGDLLIGFFEWFLNWPYQTHRLSMRVPEGFCHV